MARLLIGDLVVLFDDRDSRPGPHILEVHCRRQPDEAATDNQNFGIDGSHPLRPVVPPSEKCRADYRRSWTGIPAIRLYSQRPNSNLPP